MHRITKYIVLALLVSHGGFATADDCYVHPKAMLEYPSGREIALRTGAVHWLGGIEVSGPRCVTREDNKRTTVTIIVARTNVSDSTIISCALFSFTAVAQYRAGDIPCRLAKAVIPSDHDCTPINLKPGDVVQDSLVFSYSSLDAQENGGVIDFRCTYYDIGPKEQWRGKSELDLGAVLVPYAHAN